MEFEEQQQGVFMIDVDQFCPLQHPIQPPEEDRPVQCPNPPSCPPKSGKEEEFSCEALRRKAKLLEVIIDRKEPAEGGSERPRRSVRRRRHFMLNHHSQMENTAATSIFTVSPGLRPFQSANSTVNTFQKLDHSNCKLV